MHLLSRIILRLATRRELRLVDVAGPLALGRPKRSLQLGGVLPSASVSPARP